MSLRTIRCPNCGFFLLNVFGQDHYYLQVKCQKCKFSETIDTALFRTMSKRRQKRLPRARRSPLPTSSAGRSP